MTRTELRAYRRYAILEFIDRYWRENWVSPTVSEICEAAGIASKSTTAQYLAALVREGALERKRVSSQRVLYRLTPQARLAMLD